MLYSSTKVAQSEVALSDGEMNICHSNVLSFNFMEGNHIVIDGCLKISLFIEAISHLDKS